MMLQNRIHSACLNVLKIYFGDKWYSELYSLTIVRAPFVHEIKTKKMRFHGILLNQEELSNTTGCHQVERDSKSEEKK